MFSSTESAGVKLALFALAMVSMEARSRTVAPVDDLETAAAEPRPVFVEDFVKRPQVLPLVAADGFQDASERVEKVLRRPVAFSYNRRGADQTSAASEETKGQVLDQKPSAIDYYKYMKRLEEDEEEDGAGSEQLEKNEDDGKAESSQEVDSAEDHAGLKKEDEEHESKGSEEHEEVEESKGESSESSNLKAASSNDNQAENYEVHESHGHAHGGGGGGGGGGHKHGHGGGGGGGGGDVAFKKGGGKDFGSDHKSEHGEKGDKGYKGHHTHENGKKGHHNKEDHDKEYDEKGGDAKKHHHEDGYHGEKHHGEEGHKEMDYKEEGEHSKGHSTKGSHNIHKKDEYEKKQEFYEEEHEGGEFEKDGEYFHEDDFHKGSYEKGDHKKGGDEKAHHGKKDHYEKGGHYKEEKGHKDAEGHDKTHDHVRKHGEGVFNSGGKKWGYKEGEGGDDGGHKGSHSHPKYAVHEDVAEKKEEGKGEETKGKTVVVSPQENLASSESRYTKSADDLIGKFYASLEEHVSGIMPVTVKYADIDHAAKKPKPIEKLISLTTAVPVVESEEILKIEESRGLHDHVRSEESKMAPIVVADVSDDPENGQLL